MSVSFQTDANQGEAIPVELQTLELGNSERIRLKFGSYGIEVIENGRRIRVSELYSVEDGLRTNRTFAVVNYPSVIAPEFKQEHEEITNGKSIGIVFKNHNWEINKRNLYFGEVERSPEKNGTETVFGDIGTRLPVVHVYALIVKKDHAEFHYASIAEVHHPGYLNLNDLQEIYGCQYHQVAAMEEQIQELLQIVKTKMQDS